MSIPKPEFKTAVHTTTTGLLDEAGVVRLAQLLALEVRRGDVMTLSGDLGAGKSTFARGFVRSVLGDATADVPSPTFSLIQSYEAARFDVAHLDLYRISRPDEIDELGIDEARERGVVLVEWPDRGARQWTGPRLDIVIAETDDPELRQLTLTGSGGLGERLARAELIGAFLAEKFGPISEIEFMQGDASARAYARIHWAKGVGSAGTAVLMDAPRQPDGPAVRDGRPYSRIAHLAETVRPFVALSAALDSHGFSVPRVTAFDFDRGLLMTEDLGSQVFGSLVADGHAQEDLWMLAVDALVALRRFPAHASLALPDGSTYRLPKYDAGALTIETELLLDWLWSAIKGEAVSATVAAEFRAAWAPIVERLTVEDPGLVLRDYHSPNLMLLPQRRGLQRVGIIDFQDAVLGPRAYDLVSLLRDARLDVPEAIERRLYDRYVETASATEPHFDAAAFSFAYAALGLQRNTKILGIFARLSRRDGKHRYLSHIPRIWRYVTRSLAHPELADLANWYDRHWPSADRRAPAEADARRTDVACRR